MSSPPYLILDCDGTIAETELLYLEAMNRAFRDKGLRCSWDQATYSELFKVGATPARLTYYFNNIAADGWPDGYVSTEDREALVIDLKESKDKVFEDVLHDAVKAGTFKTRPGIKRIVDEALSVDDKRMVTVCSNTHSRMVSMVIKALFSADQIRRILIIGGDQVENKKPHPEIYLRAARVELGGVDASQCVVIEDSSTGAQAAKRAGMKCIVTPSLFTGGEDFASADLILNGSLEEHHTIDTLFRATRVLLPASSSKGKQSIAGQDDPAKVDEAVHGSTSC